MDPIDSDDETQLLHEHLQAQRRHVLGTLEGLSDDDLRRPVLPSGWTCLGLVQHLTSMEHYWFDCVMSGASLESLPPHTAEWQVPPATAAAFVLARYREQAAASDTVVTTTPLTAAPRQPDPAWSQLDLSWPTLRSIVLHVLTETATHAGHLDATRELIDHRLWLVLD